MKKKIVKIKSGTVIDHIPAGRSLKILKAIGHKGKTVLVAMNVKSKKLKKKDILKLESRSFSPAQVKKVFKIAPRATVNTVRGSKVVKKRKK
jgi:aspartate carbamoyltransferase regulatory subunit